jgi:Flp pilus assembly protein CpaB
MSAHRPTNGRHIGWRIVTIIVVVLILSGCGATSRGATATPGVVYNVIIAARDMPAGAQLEANYVTIMAWPVDVPLPRGAILFTPEDGFEQVVGRTLTMDVLDGMPMMEGMFSERPED